MAKGKAKVGAGKPREETLHVEWILLDQLICDPDVFPRAEFNKSLIAKYAQSYLRGEILPPPIAFFDGEKYWLSCGFHRVEAMRTIDRKKIQVHVARGGKDSAILLAATDNVAHGMALSTSDERKIILHLVFGDPQIHPASAAKLLHVDESVVRAVCNEKRIANILAEAKSPSRKQTTYDTIRDSDASEKLLQERAKRASRKLQRFAQMLGCRVEDLLETQGSAEAEKS